MPTPTAAGIERHPHLAEPVRAGWVRVDFHSHTMWSGDCTTTPDEIEEAVVASGIDVLCITDHNAIRGAVELAKALPCRVIVGEELRTHAGEVIGLFLSERVPFGASRARGRDAHPRAGRARLHPAPVRPHAPQPARGRARAPSPRTSSSTGSRRSTRRRRSRISTSRRPRSPVSSTCLVAQGATRTSPRRSAPRSSRCPTSTGRRHFLASMRERRRGGPPLRPAPHLAPPDRPFHLDRLTPASEGQGRRATVTAAVESAKATRSPSA